MDNRMIENLSIVCFGSDQWTYPGFQQTVMRHLSKHNRILYVNALGTRKATFHHKNLKIYYSRLRRLFAGTRKASDTATVMNPFFVPLLHNKAIDRFNTVLLRRQFAHLFSALDLHDYVLWAGTPSVAPFLCLFRPDLLIYNPVDRYSAFSFNDRDGVLRHESTVASAADLIITTADAIKEDMTAYNKNCDVVGHGVMFDHFNKAMQDLPVPEDLKGIKKPTIGFFGSLSEWVDLELIKKVALRYTQATVLLVGKAGTDVSLFSDVPNVSVLGFRDFDTLPAYLRVFDVCIIPFHLNELVDAVDPIKLREYLCAGKPVVTTNFREARKFADFIYIGRDHEEFVEKVGQALAERDPNLIQERVSRVRKDDWPRKIGLISSLILNALDRKNIRVAGRNNTDDH